MISVVVVNWNGKAFLGECLDSLRRQSFSNCEVLVVDNGSTDGSVQWIATNFPEFRTIALKENLGFAGGCNAGIRQAQGGWIALLNNDAVADVGWLQNLSQAVEYDPDVGLAASRVILTSGSLDSAGDAMTIAGVPYKRGHGRAPNGVFTTPEEVFGVCGCAALLRKQMLDEIGLLDEDFFCIYEDGDLSFRAHLSGYRCIYVPDAVVHHRLNTTLGKLSRTYVFYGQRNMEYLYFKNMPVRLLWKYLAVHLASNLLGFGYFTLKGQSLEFLRAKVAFLRSLRQTLKKRHQVQSLRRVGEKAIDGMLDRRWLSSRIAGKI